MTSLASVRAALSARAVTSGPNPATDSRAAAAVPGDDHPATTTASDPHGPHSSALPVRSAASTDTAAGATAARTVTDALLPDPQSAERRSPRGDAGQPGEHRAVRSRAGRTPRWARCRPQRFGGSVVGGLVPGLALTAVVTALVLGVAQFLPTVSPLLIAIVVGALLANCVALPQRVQPGLQFSAKKLLRLGVALLGFQLTFADIVGLGPAAIAVVVSIVVLGICGTMLMGRLLGVSWTQRLLIACGFSICGAAAAAAVDGVVDAEDEELLTAVALVVVFGTLMIGVIPLLAGVFDLDDHTAGIWAGGAVHEVAQVVATGGALGGAALTVAVVVKLARVVLLAPVLAVIGWQVRRRSEAGPAGRGPALIPLFVIAFLVCAALRTTGVVPEPVLDVGKLLETALLTAAMFALGAGVRVSALRRVGPRPLVLALLATIWVAGIALGGALLVG